MATWMQWSFQDSCSPLMEEFSFFYDFTMCVLLMTITAVLVIMVFSGFNLNVALSILESQTIECVWTLLPAIILVAIAAPSLSLLYLLDDPGHTSLTLKTVGHQWYWSYEYCDLWNSTPGLEYDSYLTQEASDGHVRLLDVDNRIPMPFLTPIRVLVSSADVLHSWAVPAIGVKADAAPGRLNQLSFYLYRPGLFFGQCSEICGANHSFMPICVESISMSDFFWWLIA